MKGSSKATGKGLVCVEAYCECGWSASSRNAQALAAKHHARCGQTTHCLTTYRLVWSAEQGEDAA